MCIYDDGNSVFRAKKLILFCNAKFGDLGTSGDRGTIVVENAIFWIANPDLPNPLRNFYGDTMLSSLKVVYFRALPLLSVFGRKKSSFWAKFDGFGGK